MEQCAPNATRGSLNHLQKIKMTNEKKAAWHLSSQCPEKGYHDIARPNFKLVSSGSDSLLATQANFYQGFTAVLTTPDKLQAMV